MHAVSLHNRKLDVEEDSTRSAAEGSEKKRGEKRNEKDGERGKNGSRVRHRSVCCTCNVTEEREVI